jgi:ribosomal protein S18 acetylase RimI-like enzyme
MHNIIKATVKDAALLSKLSVASFLPAHGQAASKEIMDNYIAKNFTEQIFVSELMNPDFQYYLIYYKNEIAGFSKVIFNLGNDTISNQNITKMERLYLLKEFYNLGLGKKLFNFNVDLSKENKQSGIWLYVWVENHKAVNFYKKAGFVKIADYNFPLTDKESRPNYVLYLAL